MKMPKFFDIKKRYIISKQRKFETHVCKYPSFVRHQQHLIDRFADGSVVVPLI